MAAKEQVIPRRHGKSVAHKSAGVEDQSASHAAGYAIYMDIVCQTDISKTSVI